MSQKELISALTLSIGPTAFLGCLCGDVCDRARPLHSFKLIDIYGPL